MQQFYRVNKDTGLFIEPVLFDDGIIPVDEDIVLVNIPEGFHLPKWDKVGRKWIEGKVIAIEDVKKAKIKQLKQKRNIAIVSGFQSTTILANTNKAHLYGSDPYDQANMTGKLAQMNANPTQTTVSFKVADDKAYVSHTRDEYAKVCNEGITHIEGCLLKCESLEAQVNSATTKEAIDLISW